MFKIENLFSQSVDSILADFNKTVKKLEKRQAVVSELSKLDRDIVDKANARLYAQAEEFKRAGVVIERIKHLIN